MRSLITMARSHKKAAAIWGVLLVAVLVVAFIATANATDNASFCTTCHEMTPFYNAWTDGPHAGVACVDCHVDEGVTNRVTHKFEALSEVYSHFVNEPLFPMGKTEVPDRRCLTCHTEPIDPGIAGFDHETHRSGRPCASCHADVGHRVSREALAEAGVLDAEAFASRETAVNSAVGKGAASIPGHVDVVCATCHDMAQTACASCHVPGHEPRNASADCTDCHSAGAEWAFTHPARTDCAECHETPAPHFPQDCETCHSAGDFTFEHPAAESECTACHERPDGHQDGSCGACHETATDWDFKHPAGGSECTSCHTRPAKHATGACSSCHATSSTWRFSHPRSEDCASCHAAPTRHYGGSCASCHSPSTPFRKAVYKHPGASAQCTSCHARPSGHSSAPCSACHRPASSWAFTHPSSSGCSSCHRTPASHYGTACASCHSPAASWDSATFSHARIPGGEHTHRSFSCATCHPRGYSSYSCLKCHSDNSGGDDDDDD